MYENPSFEHKALVSLLISKVFYHLGEYNESLKYALGAGSLFDPTNESTFTNTILARAIDVYVDWVKQINYERVEFTTPNSFHHALSQLIEGIFKTSIEKGHFNKCIGLAIDCRRFDICQWIIGTCTQDQRHDLLCYAKAILCSTDLSSDFSIAMLRYLVTTAESLPSIDYFFIFNCLWLLNVPKEYAKRISSLLQQPETKAIAMQICFDLNEKSSSEFRKAILDALELSAPANTLLFQILSGTITNKLYLEFLCRNNHSDLIIIENSKTALSTVHSHYISAVAFSNALTHAGTTCDEFLRKNMDYFKHAVNWAKFNSIACVGMIHKGNEEGAFKILQDYLPPENSQSSSTSSPFAEGGSLFALGLIHSNQTSNLKVIDYLNNAVKFHKKEPLLHGACLGLGIVARATDDRSISESLFSILFSDNAVTGEAAAIAIGLVSMGKGCLSGAQDPAAKNTVYSSLRSYCQETQHEKIKRGIALGIALLFYGQKEKAIPFIDELSNDSNSFLRYAAVYSIALAFAGTSNNDALKRLYNFAVGESSDEVRRTACISMGFVLLNDPAKIPGVIRLLSQSFNPHIRYGCAMAVGICSAGRVSDDVLGIVEPLLSDKTDFVRQSAMIAMSMIYMQADSKLHPKVEKFRQTLSTVISSKYEDVLVRFGAVLAQGFIDAGGRNVTISLCTVSGSAGEVQLNASAVAGTMLFSHFWNWHALIPFISLAFKPTGFIGVTTEMAVPKSEVFLQCNNAPSLFSYREPTKIAEEAEKETLVTAVLSTTRKTMARAKKLGTKPAPLVAAPEEGDKSNAEGKEMEIDSTPASSTQSIQVPSQFVIPNMSRVTPEQKQFVTLASLSGKQRFRPVPSSFDYGICIFEDTESGNPIDKIEFVSKYSIEDEALPPQTFDLME